jgi:tripartite-type tricarboxylate transporter receptor subunit TctC
MKKRKPSIAIAVLCPLMISAATCAYAQGENYPAKPVTIITDAPPGSAPDVVARFVADGLGASWRQQVVVVPRPGANGSAAARTAADAAPEDIRCSCRRYRRSWPRRA